MDCKIDYVAPAQPTHGALCPCGSPICTTPDGFMCFNESCGYNYTNYDYAVIIEKHVRKKESTK